MSVAIALENVSYSHGDLQVLNNISLDIHAEEFIGLIGPNGSGKTTLIKLILGLLNPDTGSIKIGGLSPKQARSNVGYVSQHHYFNRLFPISVRDVVIMGRMGMPQSGPGAYSQEDHQTTNEILELLELQEIQHQSLGSLSGGQMQKVWIARALVIKPEILLLDEPTANIDLKAEENIYALLKHFNQHMTIVVVSHDIAFISSYIDRVACLNHTLITHDVGSIDNKSLEKLYGGEINMIHHDHH